MTVRVCITARGADHRADELPNMRGRVPGSESSKGPVLRIYDVQFVYTDEMSKRLIDIDDKLLERARAAAGTATIKATVEAGLRRLANEATVVEHIRWLRRSGTLSVEKLAEARGSRVPLK